MLTVGRRAALAASLCGLLVAVLAPAAGADSLVYVRDGNVWISGSDGSNPKQVTGGPNNWSWPTEDDSGVILAAGGQGGVSGGVEDTAGSEIYRINQQGASLSAPQQTPGSMSTAGCVTFAPQSLRVAPDGRHYAYDSYFCGQFITQVGTVGAAGFTSSEYMSDFQYPYWVDNSDFVVSRGGQPLIDSDGEWWVHDLGDKANTGFNWFGDPATYAEPGNPDGWATGFDGIAVSRDGRKVATVEEDAGNWADGAARKVAIRLWSASGAPTPAHPTVATPTFKCELDLPGDPNVTGWYDQAGPTFSPDGSRLAFAEPDGVHIADVSNLGDCPSAAPLVIPAATEPFWSAADEAADAGYVDQGAGNNGTGNNGGNNNTGGANNPGGGNTGVPPAPVVNALRIQPHRFSASRARSRRGATVTYKLSEPARVTFVVEASSTGRSHGRACVKPTKRLRHARRCTLLHKVGSTAQSAQSGPNRLAITGRIGNRRLGPGAYLLVVTAVDAGGRRSATRTVSFTIVR